MLKAVARQCHLEDPLVLDENLQGGSSYMPRYLRTEALCKLRCKRSLTYLNASPALNHALNHGLMLVNFVLLTGTTRILGDPR
jgi:hypothetical protein